jgi:U3 small nucleolar RNA-associated protein 5
LSLVTNFPDYVGLWYAGATLVVAVGSAAKPRFERVPMGTTAVKSSKITFLQPPPSSDGLIRPAAAPTPAAAKQAAAAAGSSGKAAAAAAAEVLGADNAGELVQQRQSKSSKKRSEPEPDGAQQQQQQDGEEVLANGVEGMETDEEQEASGEPTLGQRVLELEQQQRQQQGGAVQVAAAEAAAGDAAAAAAAAAAIPAGPLKADSLAVLLSQALRSSDRALLERCLSVGRERVITNSVKRLVPMDAALLLKAAVERLQTKPSRGQQLAAWIQAVLLHHTAYLMSAPAAAPLMSSLYQIIEARLAMQRQMLSLAGRLELLLAQRGPEGPAGGAAAAAPDAQVRVRPAQVLGLHCAMCSACLWLQTVYSIAAAAG